MSTRTDSALRIGVVAGVIGAIVTIVLYWINLSIFDQPLITRSGVWITIIFSLFLTGLIPILLDSDGGMGMGFAGGLIGAVVTILIYWTHLIVFGQPFVTGTGVWITVLVSAFLTGWTPFAVGS